jgi:RecA/RadA recombinase
MSSKKFDLDEYKKSIKVADTPLKKDKFVEVDPCLQSTIGLSGVALGHCSCIYGKPDTGKTTVLLHIAAQAQQQGIMPILVVTEGKISWDRAKEMGFEKENAIVEENCEFLEDVFAFMDKIVSDVISGRLPSDCILLWDSVGNTLSRKEVKTNADGTIEKQATMMLRARVLSDHIPGLVKKINETRKVMYPKTVGLVILNQAYTEPPKYPGAMSALKPKGGDAILYASSLLIKTAKKSKLKATKGGKKISFGILSTISVEKNHISAICNQGDYVIVSDRILPNLKSAIDAYKKEKAETWGETLDITVDQEDFAGGLDD